MAAARGGQAVEPETVAATPATPGVKVKKAPAKFGTIKPVISDKRTVKQKLADAQARMNGNC